MHGETLKTEFYIFCSVHCSHLCM